MNLNKCIEIIDEQILSIKRCIPTNHNSLDFLRDVRIKITQFIRSLFSDSANRIRDFDKSMDKARKREKGKNVDEQAKVMISYLSAIKDELNLKMESEIKEDKLIKLRTKVQEKEIESERREKVAETKFYGAAIEIIDRLRDELKNKNQLAEDIISIRRDISEIKEILGLLVVSKVDNSDKVSIK